MAEAPITASVTKTALNTGPRSRGALPQMRRGRLQLETQLSFGAVNACALGLAIWHPADRVELRLAKCLTRALSRDAGLGTPLEALVGLRHRLWPLASGRRCASYQHNERDRGHLRMPPVYSTVEPIELRFGRPRRDVGLARGDGSVSRPGRSVVGRGVSTLDVGRRRVSRMPDIVLDDHARLLVLLHAAAAIVLVGSSTHHALIARGYLRGQHKVRLGRIYAATMAVTYAITFVFGLLAYPAYRYYVRGLYFDRYERWASNLFDIKENFAALGLPCVIAILVLSRVMSPKDDQALVPAYAAFSFIVVAIVWFDVISGLLVTMAKGV